MDIEENKSKKSSIKDWIITIVIFFVAFFVIRNFVGQPVVTNGESMSPTIVHGDSVFVEKFTYIFSEPKFSDVIVFPYSEQKEYIKRIIGVPGDTIDFYNDRFYINGQPLDDPFYIENMPLGDTMFPLEVPEDEYFVLGDNRAVSNDSRHSDVGLIKKDDIVGRAVFIFYPFERMQFVK